MIPAQAKVKVQPFAGAPSPSQSRSFFGILMTYIIPKDEHFYYSCLTESQIPLGSVKSFMKTREVRMKPQRTRRECSGENPKSERLLYQQDTLCTHGLTKRKKSQDASKKRAQRGGWFDDVFTPSIQYVLGELCG